MTPILSHQSTPNETVSSTITVVKTDHTPIHIPKQNEMQHQHHFN